MYYDYGAHVKGELLVMMKNSQSVNLLIFISNTLIELFNDFGRIMMEYPKDRLRDEAQAENEDFINKLDENMRKIIKEQVKVQVMEQVSKILPRIEKTVNEQLEAEVLTCLSNKVKTSHAVAANLSELEQKNILIDKMEIILETYGDTVTFKRRRDDKDEDEEPSTTSNRGSKRRRAGKEPKSTSAPKEKTSKSTSKSKKAGPTFELMKGSCKSLMELEYFLEAVCKVTTDQLDWNNPEGHGGVSSRTYATLVMKTKAVDYGHIKWIEDFIPNLMWINRDFARDVYSKHKILAVTQLKIVEWHNYKHLDWITIRKLTNLNVEERVAFGVSLGMFTRSIVLRRHVEDFQFGVESYQKKLNLTREDTYRSDLKRKSAYTAYSNPKGFIYQNKDKKKRLMRIDELY
ncbi:hypothetical protein Tco_0839551 [Tanacetum coccineum]|uniref:Uncharacterized protein n=1 Tax=Tanacetum coccineum TaxID=301880 RepID=A0ABQ5ASS5_9ASTR